MTHITPLAAKVLPLAPGVAAGAPQTSLGWLALGFLPLRWVPLVIFQTWFEEIDHPYQQGGNYFVEVKLKFCELTLKKAPAFLKVPEKLNMGDSGFNLSSLVS